jgi:hypothetical protein
MLIYILLLFILIVWCVCGTNTYEPMLTSADLSSIKEHLRKDGYVNALPMSKSWTSSENTYNILGVRGDGAHHILEVKMYGGNVRYTVVQTSTSLASMHSHDANIGSNINTL